MNDELTSRCVRFFECLDGFLNVFPFETRFQRGLCAVRIAAEGGNCDAETLKRLIKTAKKMLPGMSMTRAVLPGVCTLMAGSDEPEAAAERVKAAYSALRTRFGASEYAAIAAVCLAEEAEPDRYPALADAVRAAYDAMKSKHRLRTSSRDVPLCTLLALRGADPASASGDAEACFRALRREHGMRCRWCTAEAAALDGRPSGVKAQEIASLLAALRREKRSFRDSYELSSLAIGSEAYAACVNDALAVYDMLSSEKKLNALHLEASERLALAFMLVSPSKELYLLLYASHLEKRAAYAAAAAS